MIGYIYKITNLVDGKIYIGQTIKSIEERWKSHLSPHSTCTYLKRAIQFYGPNKFKIELLTSCEANTKSELINELNKLEHKSITLHNCISPNGYNIREGGRSHIKPHGKSKEESVVNRANGHKKKIICNETGQIWNSVIECAQFFNVKPKQISRVLKGQRKHLKWKFSFSYLQKQS